MAHLISVSSQEIIDFPEGEKSIGRGPLLKVVDKRVSRNHALLRLTSNGFSLCPKHPTNSCFFKAANQTSYIKLDRDEWKDLKDKDCFSLLPAGELAFQIVQDVGENTSSNITQTVPIASFPDAVPSESPGDPVTSEPTPSPPPEIIKPVSPSPNPPPQTPPAASPNCETLSVRVTNDDDPVDDLLFGGAPLQSEENKEISRDAVGDSVSKSRSEEARVISEGYASKKDRGMDMTGDRVPAKDEEQPELDGQDGKGVNIKRAGSTNKPRVLPAWLASIDSSAETGRIVGKKRAAPKKPAGKQSTSKSGSPVSPEPPPTKKPSRAGPKKKSPPIIRKPTSEGDKLVPAEKVPKAVPLSTPSQGDSDADSDGSSQPGSQMVHGASKRKKPLCRYGTACYRKNPAHFREFSHDFAAAHDGSDDDDKDNSGGSPPECPYGSKCFRKNPAHLREYTHPPPAASTAPTRQSTRVTRGKRKKSALADNSDDDGEPNTYDYNDSFIDDDQAESSSSAYASDDSDWVPGGGKEEEAMEDEDVTELVADAEDFIKNKRMRR